MLPALQSVVLQQLPVRQAPPQHLSVSPQSVSLLHEVHLLLEHVWPAGQSCRLQQVAPATHAPPQHSALAPQSALLEHATQ